MIILQVVLWDKIIKRGEDAMLDYRSMNTKYYFWDDGNGLKSVDKHIFLATHLGNHVFLFRDHQNVTLTLSWNVIPNAGNLPRVVAGGSHSFKFPSEYTTSSRA